MDRDDRTPTKRQRTAAASSTTGTRITQRPPLSCVECSRRKIKCDRSIPCRQCINRGEDRVCRREAVTTKGELHRTGMQTGKRKTFEELLRQVDDLSNRVEGLERGRTLPTTEGAFWLSRAPSPTEVDTTRLPGVMEEAALGIGETSRWKDTQPGESRHPSSSSSPEWYTPRSFEDCLAMIPPQSQARALVAAFEESAGWITGSVHIPTLLKDQDTFWIQLEAHRYRDDIWLALYLAVQSVSAFFVDEEHARATDTTVSQLRNIGRTCFDAAIATIFRCNGMTCPTIVMCQAVQTLGPAFHFTSNTYLHRSLTPICTSHARSLNLHLLGRISTKDGDSEHDIWRRVWWNQVEPDWTFLPYHRYCAISPRHFTTAFAAQSPGDPISYRAVCYRAARILCDLFGDLPSDQDPSYDAVSAASSRIHEIRKEAERARPGNVSQSHSGLRIQQSLINMTIAYRDYQCHRLYFVRSLTDNRYAKSYTACINAAETIHAVSYSQIPSRYLLMWNAAVMVVASGIILALDHILNPTTSRADGEQDQRPVVASVSDRLRQLQDPSGIASRGATLIDHLLVLGDQHRLGLVKEVTITRDAVQQLVNSSQSTHIPDDMLWQQHTTVYDPAQHQSVSSSVNPFGARPLAEADEVVNDQFMWTDDSNVGVFSQDDFDFDFARLLGQIMPNAG